MRKKGDRRKKRRLEEGIWPMGQIPSSNPFLFTINGILLNWNTGILFNWNKQHFRNFLKISIVIRELSKFKKLFIVL